MHSSIAQKAKIAGLEAEREAKIKTQEAEIEIQRIKENHDIELKRRLRVAKQKIEVLKMDEQLAEARAIEQYINNANEQVNKVPDLAKTHGLAQENLEEEVNTKDQIPQYHIPQPKSVTTRQLIMSLSQKQTQRRAYLKTAVKHQIQV